MYTFYSFIWFICVFGCIICFIMFHWLGPRLIMKSGTSGSVSSSSLRADTPRSPAKPELAGVRSSYCTMYHHFDRYPNKPRANVNCPKFPGKKFLKEQNKTSLCKSSIVLRCVMSLKPCLRLRSLCFYGCFSYHLQAGDAPLDVESGCLPIMHSSDILPTISSIPWYFVSADSPHLPTELVIEGQLQPTVRSETPTSFTTGGAQRPERRHWHPRC